MKALRNIIAMLALLASARASAYPTDGFAYTGIRRLQYSHAVQLGLIPRAALVAGQFLPLAQVLPRWTQSDGSMMPPVDAELSRRLSALVDSSARSNYGVAVLDLTDPAAPRYAVHNGDLQANVGSVGKILVALALFQTLADLYPDDLAARERVLRDTRVSADEFSQYDFHHVPFFDLETRIKSSRSIRIGDEASLWEYMDWMLSASSNSAGSMVEKELLALRHFGRAYPPPREEYDAWFRGASRHELGELLHATMDGAVQRNGLDPSRLRQGSLFTGGGDRHVERTPSYATPDQLVRYLFKLEAGTLVDAFSSREIKRLLYMTQRRIRYASHPALDDAAVYFKSGSFYQCNPGTPCGKYKGDKTNRLASVAIIESPAEAPVHRYLVAVMSNVLRVNSAVAHQTLAMRIQRLVQGLHPAASATPPESAYPTVPVDDPEEPQPANDTP